MSKSIYNSLKFLETSGSENIRYVLHIQNKSQSQQNKLSVKDKSGQGVDTGLVLPENLDFRASDNESVHEQQESIVYLATSTPAVPSMIRPVTISKLVYDYIANRLGGTYPPYESFNMSYSEGGIAFELSDDPASVADTNGNIRFPIILNVPIADAELAISTIDPEAVIGFHSPVVTVRENNELWNSLPVQQHLFKTPDGLWWLAFDSQEQSAETYGLLQYGLKILFNADGDKSETVREATLYNYPVTMLAANYDPCANATREVVIEFHGDTEFTVTLAGVDYQFASLEDFRVNAAAKLPANIKGMLLNKFIRPDISCAGATSSVYIDARSTDLFNIVIGETEYKNLTYAQFVALLETNNCIVKRTGTLVG